MRTLTVTGTGSASVAPDSALVRVAATHRADGVTAALAGVSSTVEAIGEVARRFTDAARIGSQGLSVWPSHDYDGMPSGFEARHSLAIGCDDLTAAGELVASLAKETGDRIQVESVGLDVADRTEALASAREAAWADALARAEQLAGLAGASVGEVQSVSEGGGPHVVDGGEVAVAASRRADVGFEPGQTSVSATVTVTFQLV
ncbi:SIMPL domain-containing protein [Nocardioides sp. GCM10027113]|uniref:SIMPL domain-containing protein n=1 Tax=unclassified Nocardioides TaxID=2615069 RepID=UPI003610E3D1